MPKTKLQIQAVKTLNAMDALWLMLHKEMTELRKKQPIRRNVIRILKLSQVAAAIGLGIERIYEEVE